MKKLLMIACMVLMFSAVGAAQGPIMGHGDPEGPITEIPSMPVGKWWRIPEVMEQLKLTSQEQDKLEELFIENQRKIIEFRGAWAKEKFELEQLLDKKDIDDAACMEQFKKMFDKRAGIVTERFRHVLDIRKVLGNDRFQLLRSQVQSPRDLRIKEMKELKEKRGVPDKFQPPAPPEKKQ